MWQWRLIAVRTKMSAIYLQRGERRKTGKGQRSYMGQVNGLGCVRISCLEQKTWLFHCPTWLRVEESNEWCTVRVHFSLYKPCRPNDGADHALGPLIEPYICRLSSLARNLDVSLQMCERQRFNTMITGNFCIILLMFTSRNVEPTWLCFFSWRLHLVQKNWGKRKICDFFFCRILFVGYPLSRCSKLFAESEQNQRQESNLWPIYASHDTVPRGRANEKGMCGGAGFEPIKSCRMLSACRSQTRK